MSTRKTVLPLIVAEGALLWLTAVVGVAVADAPGTMRTSVLVVRCLAFAVICVAGLYLADLYDIASVRRTAALRERLPRALVVTLCLLVSLYTLVPVARLNMAALIPCALVAITLLFAVRAALGPLVRRRKPERIFVLGSGGLARSIVQAVRVQNECVIVGKVGLAEARVSVDGTAGLVSGRELEEMLRAAQPDRIVVAVADRRAHLPRRQLLEGRLHGIAVEDGVLFFERIAGKIAIESLNPGSVAFGDGFDEEDRLHATFARALGLVAALIGLIILSPLLLLVCFAIRATSPGPIFFVQQRVGRRDRAFGLIKLRTMYQAKRTTSEWAGDNEHRVTPIGRWLRRYRIDELPQLINVLKGDMNLVGPRPHPVSNHNMFKQKIPHYALRSIVRPGITGWAQVRYGYANNLEQEIEKMRFDLFYIRHVSIWLDLRVLLETLRVLARGQEGLGQTAAVVPEPRTVSGELSRSQT